MTNQLYKLNINSVVLVGLYVVLVTATLGCVMNAVIQMPLRVLNTRKRLQYVPNDLSSILVTITFQWNVEKLVFLRTMLETTTEYKSHIVDVLLVTDSASNLQRVTHDWAYPLNLTTYHAPKPSDENSKYWLTWEHRKAIEIAVSNKNYSTVIYMEDDTYLPWHVLVSWAIDNSVLQSLGWSRCFYRTEVDPSTAKLRLMDYRFGIDRQFDIRVNASHQLHATRDAIAFKSCGLHRDGQIVPCVVHTLYGLTAYPYQGMWIANAQLLHRFMRHPAWNKYGGMHHQPDTKHNGNEFGYPERAASILILIDAPPGAYSRCVVPLIDANGTIKLSPLGRIEHMRNAYSNWGNIMFDEGVNTTRGHLRPNWRRAILHLRQSFSRLNRQTWAEVTQSKLTGETTSITDKMPNS